MKGLFTSLAISSSLILTGCNLTDEEKEKLDNAATDLEKLADQIIITSPAKDSVVNDSIVTVRADIPADANAKEVALYVDGIEIAKDTDGAPWEIQWPAYYYADGNKHTLLLKTITGSGNEVRNNEQFQLTVAESANQALAFSDGVDGTQIQDQNQLEVSFNDFPTATRYEVSDGVQIVETTSTVATIRDLEVGSYSLRYRAVFDYSASTTLTGPWSAPTQIEVLPPQLPVINDPVVVKNEFGYEVTFSWEPVSEEDSYSISIKKSGEVESQLISANALEELVIPGMKLGMYTWSLIRTNSVSQSVHSEPQDVGAGVFKTQLGGTGNDYARRIIASQLGGYLVLASTSSYEVASGLQGHSDDWIIRLDDQGNLVDEYIENKSGSSRLRDMIEASDGSIYLVGEDWDTRHGLVVKLDSNLNPVWDTEVLYRPADISDRYEFNAVAEWNNKLYVSAVEWARDGSYSYRDRAHLHAIDPSTGAVGGDITLPIIPDVRMESIRSIVPRSGGGLTLIGEGKSNSSDPLDSFWEGGALALTLDADFTQASSWNNVGEYHHLNVGNGIQLSTGKFAVVGQGNLPGVALSVLNSDGTHHRSYTTNYNDNYHYGSANLAELSDGSFVTFLYQHENGSTRYLIKGYNENLLPIYTSYLDFTGSISANGIIVNEEDSISLLYSQTAGGSNHSDIIVERIALE